MPAVQEATHTSCWQLRSARTDYTRFGGGKTPTQHHLLCCYRSGAQCYMYNVYLCRAVHSVRRTYNKTLTHVLSCKCRCCIVRLCVPVPCSVFTVRPAERTTSSTTTNLASTPFPSAQAYLCRAVCSSSGPLGTEWRTAACPDRGWGRRCLQGDSSTAAHHTPGSAYDLGVDRCAADRKLLLHNVYPKLSCHRR